MFGNDLHFSVAKVCIVILPNTLGDEVEHFNKLKKENLKKYTQ